MDGVPIAAALDRCDARFAQSWFHWFFFAQPAPRPETVVCADPDWWYSSSDKQAQMGAEAYADYLAAIHDPETVHAMTEDYRAGDPRARLEVRRRPWDASRGLVLRRARRRRGSGAVGTGNSA
jgi:hypothetical protein